MTDDLWLKIKAEYIADETSSYRSLAAKYGTTKDVIYKRAKAECWSALRKRVDDKTTTRVVKQIVDGKVAKISGIQSAADGLVEIVAAIVSEGALGPDDIVKLTRALKDLKDIKHDLTDYELREQDARIRALEKQNEGPAQQDNNVRIEFVNGEWMNENTTAAGSQ